MIKNIAIAILAIGLAGTAYWAYQDHQEKIAIMNQNENNYQRAFNDLNYQIDVLNDKIGTTLAMNTKGSLSPALAEVWRLTNEAHNSVGQLPLTLMPFHETEKFLTNIGDFAYKTAVRDLDKSPLSDEEYNTLKSLYSDATEIRDELRGVQSKIINNDLRWMDVETALADTTGDSQRDNQVIDGLKTMDKNVKSFGQKSEYGPTFTSIEEKNIDYKNLSGSEITRKEAIERAKKYTGVSNVKSANVTENKDGSKYDFYHVNLKASSGHMIGIDLTKKGGYPIYIINDRQVSEAKLGLNDGYKKALQYLNKMGFKNMELFESTQYSNVGVYTFITVKDQVRIYPESIRIKVALDNGDIIGFGSEDYLQNLDKERKVSKPAITEEEAKKKLSGKVKIMEERLAVITNDLYEDVLCYEFMGTVGNDTYRIFINAENGHEEKVEKMHEASKVYDNVS
jgi:spore germination protein